MATNDIMSGSEKAAAALAAAAAGFPAREKSAQVRSTDPNRVTVREAQAAAFMLDIHRQRGTDPFEKNAAGEYVNRTGTFSRPEMIRYGLTVRDPWFVRSYANQKTARGLTRLLKETGHTKENPWFTPDMLTFPPTIQARSFGRVERKATSYSVDTAASLAAHGPAVAHTAPDGTIHYNAGWIYDLMDSARAKLGDEAFAARAERVFEPVNPEAPADAN